MVAAKEFTKMDLKDTNIIALMTHLYKFEKIETSAQKK